MGSAMDPYADQKKYWADSLSAEGVSQVANDITRKKTTFEMPKSPLNLTNAKANIDALYATASSGKLVNSGPLDLSGLQTTIDATKGNAPPTAPDLADTLLQSSRNTELRRIRSRQGRASSFVTGPGGTLANASLLGGGY